MKMNIWRFVAEVERDRYPPLGSINESEDPVAHGIPARVVGTVQPEFP